MLYRVKDTWLSRLHEAQTAYRQACRRADSLVHESSVETSTYQRNSAASEQAAAAAVVVAPRRSRHQPQQQHRGGGRVDDSSSSAMDSDIRQLDGDQTRSSVRRTSSHKIRSASASDAAASADIELPPRPVSPRRISDPICQHSDGQGDGSGGTCLPPPADPPCINVASRSIVTTAHVHPQARRTASYESAPSSPAAARGPCFPDEPHLETVGHRHGWRLSSSTPTAWRRYGVDMQQQHRGATSLGSLHYQRLFSSAVASPPPAARPTGMPGDARTWRGAGPPGHLLYRRPAACRSETASPVIDDDDDDDDAMSVTSPASRDRQRHTPWHVRRHLRAISERSQSSDTIYV